MNTFKLSLVLPQAQLPLHNLYVTLIQFNNLTAIPISSDNNTQQAEHGLKLSCPHSYISIFYDDL